MQQRIGGTYNKFAVIDSNHPRLTSYTSSKTECSLCPISLKCKETLTLGLTSATDDYLIISDLPVYFRLPQDYARELVETSYVNNVVNSILQLPWLCLEETTKEFGLKGTLIKAAKSMVDEMDVPYLENALRSNDSGVHGLDRLEYYLEMEINHPISDKTIYSMTFASKMQVSNENLRLPNSVSFDDAMAVGELRKNYLDSKEILIPDAAFVMHLQLSVPLLGRRKAYSCLVYCSSESIKTKSRVEAPTEDFVIALCLDSECRLSLSFRRFVVDCSTETGVAALQKLFPSESMKSLNKVNLSRFILTETECECMFPQGELYLADPNLQYLGSTQHRKSTNIKDSYTINNTQNNYFFNNQPTHVSQAFFASNNEKWSYEKPQAKEDPKFDWKNSSNLTPSTNSKKKSLFMNKTDQEIYSSSGHGFYTQEQKITDNGLDSQSESGEENDFEVASQKNHTLEEILRDSRLFKRYANSKSKNPIIQGLVTSLNSEQTTTLIESLRPLVKEICKHKYGNYIIQVVARSLPHDLVPSFLSTVF